MKNKKGEIRRINPLIINSLNEAIFIQVFQITRSSILLWKRVMLKSWDVESWENKMKVLPS